MNTILQARRAPLETNLRKNKGCERNLTVQSRDALETTLRVKHSSTANNSQRIQSRYKLREFETLNSPPSNCDVFPKSVIQYENG
jgi:hypothetical protein